MPPAKPNPDLGDVYWAKPQTSLFGDAHGDNARPVGVVELNPRVAQTLTRTTHPQRDALKVESPASVELGLQAGWWTDYKPRPIMLATFSDADACIYAGPLPEEERDDLVQLWQKSKMLGRA
jgi:hypothetical protein